MSQNVPDSPGTVTTAALGPGTQIQVLREQRRGRTGQPTAGSRLPPLGPPPAPFPAEQAPPPPWPPAPYRSGS